MIKLGYEDEKIILDYPGGPNIIKLSLQEGQRRLKSE